MANTEQISSSIQPEAQRAAAVSPDTPKSAPEEIPRGKTEDFAKLTAEGKVERIKEILGDSAELAGAYQDIELMVAGGKEELVNQEKLGLIDRLRVWRAGGREELVGRAKEAEIKKDKFEKRGLAGIAAIAHQKVEEKLGSIEQTDGQRLKDSKEALVAHKKNSEADLANLGGLGIHSAAEIEGIKAKLADERAELEQKVDIEEKGLAEKLAEYAEYREPIEEKKRELDGCALEYKGYHDATVREIATIKGNISKYKRGFDGLKLAGPTAEEYKNKVKQAIEEQQGYLVKLEAAEKNLKQRLEMVKANQKQVDDYLERISNIGQTPQVMCTHIWRFSQDYEKIGRYVYKITR